MTIQQMHYFIETCRYGRISTAAEALHISPNGLRLALHRTEQELNCKLMEWGSSGIKLTEDGAFFLKSAGEICSIYNLCEEHFNLKTPEPNIAKVAVGEKFPNLAVTHLLAAFNRSAGKYSCIYKDFFDPQGAVSDGLMEIGFDSGPIDKKKFQTFQIARYPFYAIVNCDGPYAQFTELPAKELDGAEIILNERRNKNAEFFSACRANNVSPLLQDLVGRELTVWFGVQVQPMRIGIINIESAQATKIDGLKAIPIKGKAFYENIYMFHKRGNYLSPAAERLESFVKKKLEKGDELPIG